MFSYIGLCACALIRTDGATIHTVIMIGVGYWSPVATMLVVNVVHLKSSYLQASVLRSRHLAPRY